MFDSETLKQKHFNTMAGMCAQSSITLQYLKSRYESETRKDAKEVLHSLIQHVTEEYKKNIATKEATLRNDYEMITKKLNER